MTNWCAVRCLGTFTAEEQNHHKIEQWHRKFASCLDLWLRVLSSRIPLCLPPQWTANGVQIMVPLNMISRFVCTSRLPLHIRCRSQYIELSSLICTQRDQSYFVPRAGSYTSIYDGHAENGLFMATHLFHISDRYYENRHTRTLFRSAYRWASCVIRKPWYHISTRS